MNHLLRELAPVSGEAWDAIDEEAARTLRHFLAARTLDFHAVLEAHHPLLDFAEFVAAGIFKGECLQKS